MGIELNEKEKWNFIKNQKTMNLSTVDLDENPHVVPLWYIADKKQQKIYFSTPKNTQKIKHIQNNPNVSASIEKGTKYLNLKCVLIEGIASKIEDKQKISDLERRWCQKYFDQKQKPEYMEKLYRGRKWIWLEIKPQKWMSWDNTKIDLDRL